MNVYSNFKLSQEKAKWNIIWYAINVCTDVQLEYQELLDYKDK